MKPERWHRLEELYNAALELSVDKRMLFLKDACRDDPTLYNELESLLSYEERTGQFINRPAFEVVAELMAEDKAGPFEPDKRVGKTISHFRVLERLGQGGMGIVFRAEDIHLGRQAALKFLPEETKDSQAFQRLQREARAASSLNHPNICAIYEIGEHEAEFFIAMELLDGQSLDRRIGGQPLSTEEMLTLGIQITDGLHAAHQKGIIHRDIKPANIFVTSEGQAKILDFGLAKVAPALTSIEEHSDGNHRDDSAPEMPREVEQLATPDAFLSRTGVAMGTAGYMSPEQARGEKLDARTDLFSFGLVLYEMATGQRAFSGDTGPELHDAILKQVPAPARKLNSSIPPKLEPILNRALQKNREVRYQSAAELRTDLKSLKQDLVQKPRRLRSWGVAAGFVALLLASTIVWFTKRPSSTVSDFKLRQLTINSSENRVLNGAISPDGKFVAYTDMKGMHIQVIETGATRAVPQPETFKNTNVEWEIVTVGWFPDSTRFLANAHPLGGDANSPGTSIWTVSVLGGAPRKLRDNAVAYSVSRDGSLVSFGTNKGKVGDREIWLMRSSGDLVQKLFDTDENSAIGGLLWSPDEQRVLYVQSDESGDTFVSRNLKGGPLTTLFTPSEMKHIDDGLWLSDGRFIYSVRETGAIRDTCNYWTARLDARTGLFIERPRQLTNWTAFCMNSASSSVDGKRLAFLEISGRDALYVADLEASGKRIHNSRDLVLEESNNYVQSWTPDSKAILFSSNRGGNLAIYKQSLDQDTPQLVVGGAIGFRQARVSPDGKWIMAFLNPKPGGPSAPEQLVRVPITGGSPELIFQVHTDGGISCASPPSSLCVVSERTEDRKHAVVTAFDAVRGRGNELTRFDLDPEENFWFCEISPDGTQLAVSRSPVGPLQVLSLRGRAAQLIQVKGLRIASNLSWASDGKGLFVDSSAKGKTVLFHVDLQGNTDVLWVNYGSKWAYGMPSPDGRHLAISGSTVNSNLWMMENF